MDITRLSHARALTPVRDPIHDYFEFNIFEREIIDSKYFQRLHFVLQNSMTYVAFPANKNSRFAHSLGVSHIAGRMFTSALANSSVDTAESFLSDFARFLDMQSFVKRNSIENLIKGWSGTIKGRSGFIHNPIFKNKVDGSQIKSIIGQYPTDFLIDTLWESIRICGLIHDIGHLPMSHSFEHALEKINTLFHVYHSEPNENGKEIHDYHRLFQQQFENKKNKFIGNSDEGINKFYYQWYANLFSVSVEHIKIFISQIAFHERRSLSIFLRLSSLNSFSLKNEYDSYRQLIWLLSSAILFSQSLDSIRGDSDAIIEGASQLRQPIFLSAIKKIIASELDADRLDYTVRDGHACGTYIGRFDLENIIKSTILINDGGKYYIAHHFKAVPAIEQFFSQRYDSYKYLINHRTSSRTEACLQELIARIFHFAYLHPDDKLAQIVGDCGYLKFSDKHQASPEIEQWVAEDIPRKISEFLPNDEQSIVRTDDSNLRSMLFLILLQIENEDAMFSEFQTKLIIPIKCLLKIVLMRDFSHIYSPFKEVNLREMIENSVGPLVKKQDISEFSRYILFLMNHGISAEFDVELRKKIAEASDGTIVSIFTKFVPKVFNSRKETDAISIKIVKNSEEAVNLSAASEMLNQMHHRERQESEICVYFVGENIKSNVNVLKILKKILVEQFCDYLQMSIDKVRT